MSTFFNGGVFNEEIDSEDVMPFEPKGK